MTRDEIFSHPAFLKMLDLFLEPEPEQPNDHVVTINDIAVRKDLEHRVARIQAKRKERQNREAHQAKESSLV